jgi:ribosomal protein S18 acetylase RimI-like enzyme
VGRQFVLAAIETWELEPDAWPVWRKLRQSALAEAHEAFGSALADWTGARDTEQRWLARLRDVPVNLVIALDGEPAGMVSITAPDADGAVELISMWVAPEARGRGVGDEAVRRAITRAAQRFPNCAMTLSVKTLNRHAIALYERHGFVDAGPSPDDPIEHRMCR